MSRPTQASLSRLEEILSADQILTDPEALAARQVDQLRPSAVVQPTEAAQVAEIVRFAASEQLALVACSGCTKLGIGAPPERYDVALDVSRMNRVLACDPDDLTLGVEPGVRIEDLLRTLSEHKQFLPLAVPFGGRATVGGIAAANSNSPLRHFYGGVRDYCLGMEFVTGEGEISKSGGRVVKNVTGYDLHKPLIGSLGTLAVITRVNFRMFPMPPMDRTFVVSFSEAQAAFSLCRDLAISPLTPQIVEVASPASAGLMNSYALGARRDGPAELALNDRRWSVVIRGAGQSVVVERYSSELGRMAGAAHADAFAILSDASASSVFASLCEFPMLALNAAPSAVIFRISVLPTSMPALLAQLGDVATRNQLLLATLTRPSGFMYAAFLPGEQSAGLFISLTKAATEVFQTCSRPEIAARAMIEWCPTEVKREAGVWGATRPDFELMRRVKNVFDPQSVLSPGRFAGGI